MAIPLWSINRWLRWTGFRLYLTEHIYPDGDEGFAIGLGWYGWSFVGKLWARDPHRDPH